MHLLFIKCNNIYFIAGLIVCAIKYNEINVFIFLLQHLFYFIAHETTPVDELE